MRVIKLGGRVQGSRPLLEAIASAWRAAPGSFCVVHGGGDEISALQRRLGVSPVFAGGRRVTTTTDIEIVRMALCGSVNKRLVASLAARGVSALGLSGEDASLIVARPLDTEHLGCVGEPERINAALLHHLLGAGLLPVIAPLSSNGIDARALNVNGDDAAAAIAVALGADELLFVADVPAVLADGGQLSALDDEEALALIESGVATGGMATKLQAAAAAVRRGVARVRIGDVHAIGSMGRGTLMAPVRSLV